MNNEPAKFLGDIMKRFGENTRPDNTQDKYNGCIRRHHLLKAIQRQSKFGEESEISKLDVSKLSQNVLELSHTSKRKGSMR